MAQPWAEFHAICTSGHHGASAIDAVVLHFVWLTAAFCWQGSHRAFALLQVKADAMGVPLTIAPPLDSYTQPDSSPVTALGLAGDHQRVNAALAIALAHVWESKYRGEEAVGGRRVRLTQLADRQLPDVYLQGLHACRWPGRSQVLFPGPVSADAVVLLCLQDLNGGGA